MLRCFVTLVLTCGCLFSAHAQLRLFGGIGLGTDFEVRRPTEVFVPNTAYRLGIAKEFQRFHYGLQARYTIAKRRATCVYSPLPGEVIPPEFLNGGSVLIYGYERCSHTLEGTYRTLSLLAGASFDFVRRERVRAFGSLYVGPEFRTTGEVRFTALMANRESRTLPYRKQGLVSGVAHEVEVGVRLKLSRRIWYGVSAGYYARITAYQIDGVLPTAHVSVAYLL